MSSVAPERGPAKHGIGSAKGRLRLEGWAGFLGKFTVLRGAVRELWITFAVKLVGIVAYKLMNTTLALWLTYDLGYGDANAGYLVGAWSTLMTLCAVLVGSFTDAIGLRKAFLLGLYVCIGARVAMVFSSSPLLALGLGMFPLAFGEALGTPVLVAAVRRYSTTAQRSISFAIFYAVMNGGFLIANLCFDAVRTNLGEPYGHVTLPLLGQLTTYRSLLLLSLLFELALFPILYFGLRGGVEATDEGVKITPEVPKYPHETYWRSLRLVVRDALRDTVRIFAGLWQQPGFYKFLSFLTLAAFVRLIFYQMDYTYPKFGIRELGPGAPLGRLMALNSFMIILLVPLVGAISQKISAYRMVTIGSIVAAGSVFIMALPTGWFQPVADGSIGRWVGHGYLGLKGAVHPYYVMIFLFITLLSIGESIYSPRLYEYAAAIAPPGQEASYMSLSYLPFFLAKLLVGMFSGVLLQRFCPEVGPRNSPLLWLIIAMTAAIAPTGLLLLRRFIQVREAGRDD